MPDLQAGQEPEGTTPTPTPEEEAAAVAAAAEAEAAATAEREAANTPAGTNPGTDPAGDPDGEKLDWKAKQEASANREAASYRVKLRDAEGQLTKRDDTIAELQAKVSELEAKASAATRASVAASFGLPKALADVLTGDTEEELRAHAETLAHFAGGPQRVRFRKDGQGGLDPFEGEVATNVNDAVAAARALRY